MTIFFFFSLFSHGNLWFSFSTFPVEREKKLYIKLKETQQRDPIKRMIIILITRNSALDHSYHNSTQHKNTVILRPIKRTDKQNTKLQPFRTKIQITRTLKKNNKKKTKLSLYITNQSAITHTNICICTQVTGKIPINLQSITFTPRKIRALC